MRRALFVTVIILIALPAITQETAQETITPDQLWTAMLQGNQLFVAGKTNAPATNPCILVDDITLYRVR